MSLPPIFRYFGSKHRAARRYPEPKHDVIVEPFAGGAGYSLRYPDRCVVLIERNPIVAAIWRWLIAADPDEIRALPLTVPGQSINDFDIRQEAKDWIGYWHTISGAHPQPRMVPSAGTIPSSYWNATIRERTAIAIQSIRHWIIAEGDCLECAPDVRATWFVDPPYQSLGKAYRGALPDFDRLARWLLTREGQVIVCEQEGADWFPFEPFADLHAATRKGSHRRTSEVIAHWETPIV